MREMKLLILNFRSEPFSQFAQSRNALGVA